MLKSIVPTIKLLGHLIVEIYTTFICISLLVYTFDVYFWCCWPIAAFAQNLIWLISDWSNISASLSQGLQASSVFDLMSSIVLSSLPRFNWLPPLIGQIVSDLLDLEYFPMKITHNRLTLINGLQQFLLTFRSSDLLLIDHHQILDEFQIYFIDFTSFSLLPPRSPLLLFIINYLTALSQHSVSSIRQF